jgi:hypothetical protein
VPGVPPQQWDDSAGALPAERDRRRKVPGAKAAITGARACSHAATKPGHPQRPLDPARSSKSPISADVMRRYEAAP